MSPEAQTEEIKRKRTDISPQGHAIRNIIENESRADRRVLPPHTGGEIPCAIRLTQKFPKLNLVKEDISMRTFEIVIILIRTIPTGIRGIVGNHSSI
jgi:hypothetical protein